MWGYTVRRAASRDSLLSLAAEMLPPQSIFSDEQLTSIKMLVNAALHKCKHIFPFCTK